MNPQKRMPEAIDRRRRCVHGFLFVLAMLSISLASPEARAAGGLPSGVRVAKATDKFEDVWQYGAIFKLRPPRRLRARHLELVIGALSAPSESRPFASLGPVWDFSNSSRALFLELGFSVTLLGGSTFDGRDIGGNLHFTSSVALGTRFGTNRAFALALRLQHTSNGGLNDTNPGLDAVALNFTFDLPN